MEILTNLTIPFDVYRFYLKIANNMENCTPEDIIVDALTRYAAIVSTEVLLQKENTSSRRMDSGENQ